MVAEKIGRRGRAGDGEDFLIPDRLVNPDTRLRNK